MDIADCSYPGCKNKARINSARPNRTSLCTVHKGKNFTEYMRSYMFARRHQSEEFRKATNFSASMSNSQYRSNLKFRVLKIANKKGCDECGNDFLAILRLYNHRGEPLTLSMMKRYINEPIKARLNVVAFCPNCAMRKREVNPDSRTQRERAKALAGAQCSRCGEKDQRVLVQVRKKMVVECANCYAVPYTRETLTV